MIHYIDDHGHTQKYTSEFFNHVMKYSDITRHSLFLRYLNISIPESVYNTDTLANYDHHESGLKYDVYDLTPVLVTSQLSNQLELKTVNGEFEVTTYTIQHPRVDDLLVYDYQHDREIFRIKEVSSSVFGSDRDVPLYRLTLEYSTLKTITELDIFNHYVYLTPLEKYVYKQDYMLTIQQYELLNIELQFISKTYFDIVHELFYYVFIDFDNVEHRIVPLYENKQIYDIIANKTHNFYKFNNIPFGIKKREFVNDLTQGKGYDLVNNIVIDLTIGNTPIIDAHLSFNTYTRNESSLIFDVFKLLTIFHGYTL